MASAKFLEEALSTDVDESAVSAIVGSLETQLVTSTPTPSTQPGSTVVINQNHLNSAISNGGIVPSLKHGAIANGGDAMIGTVSADSNKTNNAIVQNNVVQTTASSVQQGPIGQQQTVATSVTVSKTSDGVKLVYPQTNQAMTSTGTIIANRMAFPAQTLPNGTIGLSPITPLHTAATTTTNTTNNAQTVQNKQMPLVIKTSGAPSGLVTVPMNVTTAVPQVNNVGSTASPCSADSHTSVTTATSSTNAILPGNVQIVNVRPGGVPPAQPQKAMQSRVVLGPQLVGARQGQPQHITLQSLQGLQPGQQGHLLLKTENGQFQLLRVGPAPTAQGTNTIQAGATGTSTTFRLQTVPAATNAQTPTSSPASVATAGVTVAVTAAQTTPAQRATGDNTKEKCRKFLANLLELSSREPKSVERNVRTLIQELIDMRVEPEDFCDRLERLLNASPQPCLIGFLKKSLPLLRQSLVTKELSIEGIRPPPANVVFSVASGTPTIQTQVRPVVSTTQVRLVTPANAVVRPGQVLQQRLVTPIRGAVAQQTRMVTTIRQPNTNVIVSGTQPPALHPVYPANQIRHQTVGGVNVVRHQPITVRGITPAQTINKPNVPSSALAKSASKEKEKKSFSSAGYAGDDDINDVAAMGGVNLAEETQRILGSTEFVGTQIRSCKDEIFLLTGPLQQRIRQAMARHGLDDPSNEITAIISHATQEHLKNLVEKLAIIAEHRIEVVKMDSRYEVTTDIKGQLKFLEELDRAERKRHEEQVRELLLRAAKSRSKSEDPEQAKLKAKAKEMQRIEMEELRQKEANATALQAIGPRKKPRMDGGSDSFANSSQTNSGNTNSSGSRGQLPMRQRMKKVSMRDLLFLLENEKDLCRSSLLYKAYLK